MPAAPGAYPFSPRKLRSVVSAAVSNNTEQQKVRRTKKIYFPANTNESTIIGALQGTVSGNAKVSKTPISPNRSKSMGTYTLNVPRPVCLLHKSQSLPVKKTVSFGRKDHIREIEMVGDIPEDVVADLWWSAREYTEIRKEFEAVLFLLDTEKPIDEDENSSRGLHKRTETGAWILYENQRNARNAVLLQQDLQRKNKVTDAVEIAKAYLKESIKMRDEAVQQAAADAAAVQEFLFFAKQQQRSDPKRTNKHQAEGLSADTTHLRNKPHHASRRRAPAVFNDSIAHIGAYKSGKKAISTDDTLLDMSSKDTQSPEVRLFRNLSNDDSIEVLA